MLANALNYAVASGLLEQVDTGYELTLDGHIFANQVMRAEGVLFEEKALFKTVGKSITEKMIETASKDWGI